MQSMLAMKFTASVQCIVLQFDLLEISVPL